MEIPELPKSSLLKHLDRLGAACSGSAMSNDVSCTIQFVDASHQVSQRNQMGTFNLTDLVLLRIPDIQEEDVLPLFHLFLQRQRGDFLDAVDLLLLVSGRTPQNSS